LLHNGDLKSITNILRLSVKTQSSNLWKQVCHDLSIRINWVCYDV